MEKELKEKIKDLVEGEQRLSKEYQIYQYDLEASEPIQRNMNKIHSSLEDEVNKIKQELEEKAAKVNKEIEEKEKDAQILIKELNEKEKDGLERLEREYEIYKHSLEASEPIKRNIDKIRGKLEAETKQILSKLEEEKTSALEGLKIEKENILKELEETGINLEAFGLVEPKVEVKENVEKEVEQDEQNIDTNEEQVITENEQKSQESEVTKNKKISKLTGKNKNTENIKIDADTVKSISINENLGIVYVTNKQGEKTEISLSDVFEYKRTMYKRLDIGSICKEIAEGEISGLLLKARVNPAIIAALKNNPVEIRKYIYSLNEETELPFELTHDLTDSKLNLFGRMKMWVCARAENKIPGTKITFPRLWNKNKAIEGSKETATSEKEEGFKDIKVKNDNNQIEKNAQKNIERQQAEMEKQLSKEVKEMLK